MIGIIVIGGLFVFGLCLFLYVEHTEYLQRHLQVMKEIDESHERREARTNELLDKEIIYDYVTERWWFKAGVRFERLCGKYL